MKFDSDEAEPMTERSSEDDRLSAAEPLYTETVVEYVDNRQRKVVFAALVALLVLLALILIGSAVAVVRLTDGGASKPTEEELPEGLDWVRSIYGWGETADTSLASPTDVAIADDGTIWVVSAAQMIVGFNPDGSLKQLIRPERGFGDGQVNTLEGITIGPDGTLYVTDQGKGSIEQFSQDGTWLGNLPAEFPIEVASDGDDRIAVTGRGSFGILKLVDEGAEVIRVVGARGKGDDQFDLPHGIAFGEDGSVFISDTHNARVAAYDENGTRLWVTEGAPKRIEESKDASTSAEFQLPAGMTIDGNGRVVLVDPFGFNISVLEPESGDVLGRYGDFGSNDGLFAYPTGIDYDERHDWFAVADTANHRVQIVRIPGSGGSALATVRRSTVGPVWICCLPLFVLLALVVVRFLRRRTMGLAEEAMATS